MPVRIDITEAGVAMVPQANEATFVGVGGPSTAGAAPGPRTLDSGGIIDGGPPSPALLAAVAGTGGGIALAADTAVFDGVATNAGPAPG
jgi:hypothetical protein